MRSARPWLFGLALSVAACNRPAASHRAQSTAVTPIASAAASAAPSSTASAAPTTPTAPPIEPPTSSCVEQGPQEFLVKAHMSGRSLTSTRAQLEWWADLQRSIRYRTEQYGYYDGFGLHAWNRRPLGSQMRVVKFAGRPVQMHERVLPALRCAELAIERDCQAHPYRPKLLAGLRENNTYFGGDVSNHVYGIAIDIDPNDNPCCNCVKPWRDNPRCRGTKPDLARMTMPECWITAFERYGFYWLGHDELKDTMHFEFLGDPGKIADNDSQVPGRASSR